MTAPRSRLNRYAGTTLSRQLSAILEDKIRAGEYPPDERLPTESDLAATYDVNRITVREALGDLARRGLIHTQQGRGSFPLRPPVRISLSPNEESSVTKAVGQQHHSVETVLLDVRDGRDTGIQQELMTRGKLRCIEVLRILDGVPWMVTRQWFVARRFPGLEEHWPDSQGRSSLFDVLRADFDVRMLRANRTYWAEIAGPEESEHLGIPAGFPIFASHGLNKTPDGEPVMVSTMKSRGDRTQISINLERDP